MGQSHMTLVEGINTCETNARDERDCRIDAKLPDGHRSNWQAARHPQRADNDRHGEADEPHSHLGDGKGY